MTLQQCYEMMEANYSEVKSRLMKDERIQKILLLFLKDPSFNALHDAMRDADWDTAFRAAHTLKGISLNLGLTHLQESSSALSDALRGKPPADNAQELYERLSEDYAQAVGAIQLYQSELA